MKNGLRRVVALLTSFFMIFSSLPMTAFADIIDISKSAQISPIMPASIDPDPTDPVNVYVTFRFLNGDTVVDTQIVNQNNNESVTEPETPEAAAGKRFEGWYVGDTKFTFGVVSGYAESKTVDVTAKFSDVYYVYFMSSDADDAYVHATKEAVSPNYTVELPTDLEVKDAVVTGWVIKGTETAFTSDTVVEADTYVTPVTTPAYWVTFNTDGGTQVHSQYVTKGNSVNLNDITAPTKLGYAFGGWKGPDGNTVSGNYTPSASVVLTAIWNAQAVKYTVVYWGENADDENYSVLATDATKTALTGASLTLDASTGALPSSVTNSKYFTFEKSDTVTIAADGSSVLNVYYTRNEYTITFDLLGYYVRSRNYQKASSDTFSTQPVLTMNGVTYTSTYSFTAKYEQDISALWPTAGDFTTLPTRSSSWSGTTTYSFLGWNQSWVSKRLTLTSDIIDQGSLSAYWSTNLTEYTLNYMFETPDGSGEAYTYGGTTRYYKKSEAYSQTAYTTSGSWSAKSITGFTSVTVDQSGTTVNLYYSRNSYTLTLNNMGSQTTESILFEADISGKGATPAVPAGYTADDFKGWYEVEPDQVTDQSVPFSFEGKTMPARNLILFAKWEKAKIDVGITIKIEGGADFSEVDEGLAQGTTIASTSVYKKALAFITENNLTLLKWVDGNGARVDINTPLYGDVTITPVFVGTSYTLTYTAGEGTGADVVDSTKYGPDSEARVANSTFTAPEGQVFAYWTDAAGKTYYPGAYVEMNGNVTLTANYVPKTASVTVTYDPNGGNGTRTTTDAMQNNNQITVATASSVGFSGQTGYHFDHWNTLANGNGTSFAEGATARVTSGENVLYAIYAPNTDVSYTVHYYKEGTTESVAADKTVTDQTFNSSVTETAVAVIGYTVVAPNTQTLKLDAYGKEITFYYTTNSYAYTVKYFVDDVEDTSLAVYSSATYGSTVSTYTDKCPSGYVPDHVDNLPLTISENPDNNIISVYYKKNVFTLTVNYVYDDGTKAADTHTESVNYGAAYSVTSPSIDGYTADKATVAGTMPASDVTETVTYTKRNDLSYTVYYYLNGTTTPVASSKTVDKQTYNATVTESPATVDGYTVVSNDRKSITITTVENVITFYYYKNVTLTANSDAVTYNGSEQSVSGFTKSEDAADFSAITVGASGTDVGTYDAKFADGTVGTVDATEKYIVTEANDGKLTINPVSDKVTVTITENSATYTYDGNEHTVSGYKTMVSDNELYDVTKSVKETETAAWTAKGTNAGTYDVGIVAGDFANTNGNFTNVEFVIVDGTLKINPVTDQVTVTITENSGEYTYDGTEHTVSGYKTIESDNTLYNVTTSVKETVTDAWTAKGTNAGTYDVGIAAADFANINDNFTNVEFVIVDGTLKINPVSDKVTVTITENSDAVTYDGAEHTVSGYKTMVSDNALYDVTTSVKATESDAWTAKGTNAGTYEVGIAVSDFANTNTNFTNVEFKIVDGALTINPGDPNKYIALTPENVEKTYDGKSHSAGEAHAIDGNANDLVIEYSADGINWYTDRNYVTATNVADSKTVSLRVTSKNGNYKGYVYGTEKLTITQRAVTFAGETKTLTYTGSTQTINGITVDNLVEGQTYTGLTYAASGKNVGTYKGAFSGDVKIMSGEEDVTANYAITETPGTLTITNAQFVVTFTGESGTVTYDGEEHELTGITVEGLQEGHTYQMTYSAKGTNAGDYTGEFGELHIYDGNVDVTENYAVTKTTGKLTINKAQVDVKIHGDTTTGVYNSGSHYAKGWFVDSISNELYTTDYIAKKPGYVDHDNDYASGTDVGTYNMTLTNDSFYNTNDNFDVTFEVTNGWVKINPRPVTIVSGSAEKVYDGTALTKESATNYDTDYPSTSGFMDDQGVDITYNGSQTDVGSSKNTFEYTWKENTKSSNYKVTVKYGTLTVTKKPITVTVTGKSVTTEYDGNPHTVTGFTFEAPEGVTITLKDGKEATASRTEKGKTTMGLTADDFSYESQNYDVTIKYVDGFVEITPKSDEVVVKIQGNTLINSYTGLEQTVSGYTVTGISSELYTANDFQLKDGISAEVKATDAQDATIWMGLTADSFENTNENFANVKFVVVEDGSLTINPAPLTIKTESDAKTYDGQPLTADGTIEGFVNNETATFTVTGSQTEVGSSDNTYSLVWDGTAKESNYKITSYIGTLTVTELGSVVVTITENSGSYEYDGTEKTVTGYTVKSISSDLYKETDFTFSGDATVKGTDVGTYDMTLTAANFTNNNTNFNNVTFVIEDGTLTIKPSQQEVVVTIKGNTASKTYNGGLLTVDGYELVSIADPLNKYTASDFGFAEGKSAHAEGVDVGDYSMGLTANSFVNNNANFAKVTFNVEDGKLTITKFPLTVSAVDMTVEYDGNEHSSNYYNYDYHTLPSTDEINNVEFGGSGTDVGKYELTVSNVTLRTFDGTQYLDVTDNYEITYVPATLTITPVTDKVTVTITENSGEYTYDGTEHTVSGYTSMVSDNKLYDVTKSVKATETAAWTAKGTDAGTYDVGIAAGDFENTNKNFTNVEFVIVDGALTINPFSDKVTVTITENSGEYTYDGTEHTVSGYESMVSDNTLYDVTTSVKSTETAAWTAKGTDAGTYDVGIAAADFANTNKNFTNVEFVIVDGTLTITPVSDKVTVTITENSATYTYDGAEHTVSGYKTIESDNTLYDVTTSVKSTETAAWTAKGTDAGTYDVGIAAADFANTNANFTNVEFVIIDGALTINPVTDKVTVTITENSGEYTYDGEEHTVSGYKSMVSDNTLYDVTTSVKSTETAAWTAKGTDAGTYDVGIAAADFANTNKNFTNVEFVIVDGALTINPVTDKVTVTITENSGEYTYDGTEHTVSGYKTMVSDNALYDVTTSVKSTETDAWTAKGTNAGTYPVGIAAADFANTNANFTNVEFVIVDGTLTINPVSDKVTVTITENSDTVTYDGEEHTVSGYKTMVSDNTLYDVTTSVKETETAAWTAKGTDAGTYDVGIAAADFANTNANFTNVEFKIEDGKLTIEATDEVTVTITENSGSYTYDGTEKTVTGYTVTNISNKLYTADDFTFSGDATVKGTNAGTYDMALKPEDFKNNNDNFSKVTFVIVDGTLTINPVSDKVTVTITENSGEYTYDGTEHTVSGYKSMVSDNTLYDVTTSVKETETAAWKVTKINAGTYDVGIEAGDFANTNANFTNVEFVIVDGTLLINPAKIEDYVQLIKTDVVQLYDANTYEAGTAKTIDKLENIIKVEYSVDGVNWTTDPSTITAKNVADSVTVHVRASADNYEGYLKVDQALTINPRHVTITSDDAEKVYDGTALTDHDVTASEDGFVTGEGAEYVFTGTQTNVGESENAFTYTLLENTLAGNYVIKTVFGTLKVIGDKVIPNKTTPDVTSNYALGDKIPFTITVENVSDVEVTNVTVVDNNATIIAGTGYTVSADGHTATIAAIASNATISVNAEHTVTSDDILAGTVGNTATVTWKDGEETVSRDKSTETDKIETPRVAIDIVKYSDVELGTTVGLGDTIYYAYWIKNTGNVPYTVHVTDELVGWSKDVDLQPDQTTSEALPLENAYTVTEADLQAGSITNTITATIDPIEYTEYVDGEPVTKSTETVTKNATTTDYTVAPELLLTIIKESAEAKEYKLGDTITYTITVANTGNQTLTNVVVTDSLANAVIGEGEGYTVSDNKAVIAAIAPDKTVAVNATYIVTSDDILNGKVENTVTVTANENPDTDITPATDETEDVDTTLTVTKTSDKTEEVKLGEEITYTITVKNEGNVPYKNVKVDDALTGFTTTIGELAVGEEQSFTTKYTVTSKDILKGSVLNNVTAKGDEVTDPKNPDTPKTPEGEDEVENETDDVDTTLSVTKTSDKTEEVKLGDIITYTIVVRNEGNVPFYNVVVEDALTGLKENIEELKVGESKEFTTTYTVKSGDILNGEIENIATAKGDEVTDPQNPDAPKTPEDESKITDETEDVDTTLTVTKLSDRSGKETGLGETINYTITVKNDGNVPYYNVVVEDPLTKASWTIDTLAVDETKTFTTSHTVTSDDIKAGAVVNDATATADPITDPKNPGTPKTPNGSASVTDKTSTVSAALKVEKTSDKTGEMVKLGETINYTITVTNEGNVPYTNVKVEDALTGMSKNIAELAVGATETFTTSYTVKSSDILKGSVLNSVTASADPIENPDDPSNPKTPEGSDEITDETDDVNTTLTVTKTSNKDGQQVKLNDKITYTITVKNDGNVPYTNVVVTDDLTKATWTIDELAVGATETFETEYTVTSDDILNGKVLNSVTAKGDDVIDPKNPDTPKTPEGGNEVTDETADVDTTLKVEKYTDTYGNNVVLGQMITYSISVTNNGNVPFYHVKVEDKLVDLQIVIDELKVGETKIYTATYVVTSDDILNGKVLNTVTAKGDEVADPKNPDTPKTPEGTAEVTDVTDDVNTALTVTKTSDKTGEVKLGDTINYTITVKNEGNVPYTNVVVTDDLTKATWKIDTLAVGATETFKTEHTVTSDDILNGKVLNSVTAKGDEITDPKDPETPKTPEGGDEVTDETDDIDTTLTVTKTNDKQNVKVKLGETVNYTITVKNDGNVPYYNVVVMDQLTKATWTIDELAVDAEKTFNTSYVIVEENIAPLGQVTNVVTAEADPVTDPKTGEPQTPEASGSSTVNTEPLNTTLTVTKVSDKTAEVALGDVITYTITVKNDGNHSYTNVKVDDAMTSMSENIDKLAVGEEKSFTTTYTVTEKDILAGEIVNTVTAKGDPIYTRYSSQTPEGSATATDETSKVSTKLTVTKTSDKDGTKVKLGDIINYTITVKNEGNVPYTNVNVTDDLTKATWTIDTLAVGATETFTTSYTVKSDDILKGSVLNSVTAKADEVTDPDDPDNPKTPEGGDEITDETDDVDTTLAVTKTSDKTGMVALGGIINYTITVKNEGNVPYTHVKVNDPMTGFTATIDELAVGATETFTTSHRVTSDDILNGQVLNTVTAKGDEVTDPKNPDTPKTPEGTDSVTDETDDVDTSLLVIKSTSKTGVAELGETITYTIKVVNNGNVPYYNVAVEDALTGLQDTIEVLKVSESKTYTTTYTVTSDDILNGKVLNTVTAKGSEVIDPKNPEKPKTPEGTDEVETETEDLDTTLTIVKESDADGKEVAVGDMITYTITVTNEGNVPYPGTTIIDALDMTDGVERAVTITNVAGADEYTIDGTMVTITSLKVNQTVTITATYTVTTDDIRVGKISNSATAKGDEIPDPKHQDQPKTPEGTDDHTDETEDLDASMTVEKTSNKEGQKVAWGETITYSITVTNTGNTYYENVEVKDELEGLTIQPSANGKYTVSEDGHTAVIARLDKDEVVVVTATYVVDSEDIMATTIRNTASAKGDEIPDPKDPENPKTPEDEDETENETEGLDTTLTVVKTSNYSGKYVTEGDTITYIITVTNDGNVPYTNVVVEDVLTGIELRPSLLYTVAGNRDTAIIDTLGVKQTITIVGEYTVTADDLKQEKLFNIVTAQADSINDPATGEPKTPEGYAECVNKVGINVTVTVRWVDDDMFYRPSTSMPLQLIGNDGEVMGEISTAPRTMGSEATYTFEGMPVVDKNGTPITYTVLEPVEPGRGRYNVTYDGLVVTNTAYVVVTFVDWNGAVIKSERILIGDSATLPEEDPTREGYTFTGWTGGEWTNVTRDQIIRATYENENGTDDQTNGSMAGGMVQNVGDCFD